ncbi:MAG TPA: hypothetical protein VMN82_07995 [Thermoanaerobaculia bacterium]|nr:hypothetical protein [Thermoanaerobaculia bacterium]
MTGLRGRRLGLAAAAFSAGTALVGAVEPPPTPRPPTAAPTAVPTPVPPERAPASARKGAVAERHVARYENPYVAFSKITRVEEVDLDNDGTAEALVEGIGTVRNLPPEMLAVGFVSRSKLPFENPIFAVFAKGKGTEWNVLLVGHLPLRCTQTDDPAKCDQLEFFRSVPFRFDDRPQVALQISHAGEPRLVETLIFRLDKGRLDPTFSVSAPKAGVEVSVGPDGVTRRIAVDTFINKELPSRYRSFTLETNFVFGERKFRILSETVDPEWNEREETDLAYWGLVRQPVFAGELAKIADRQKKAEAWAFDPVEMVKRRFADARDVRIGVKESGVAVVEFERPACAAHAVLFQPLRAGGEKAIWEFAVIRAAEEQPYECVGEAWVGRQP